MLKQRRRTEGEIGTKKETADHKIAAELYLFCILEMLCVVFAGATCCWLWVSFVESYDGTFLIPDERAHFNELVVYINTNIIYRFLK